MQQMKNIRKLTGFLLLACIVQACHSASVTATTPLMCYVCENCAKITKETPLVACDAEFFEQSSTTLEPTTEASTTTTAEPTTDSTTTTSLGTTLGTTLATTTTGTTEVTTTEGSTTEGVPTAPTVGPPVTVPTPPDVGTIAADFSLTTDVTVINKNTEVTIGNYTTDATVINKNTEVTIGNYTTDATVNNKNTEVTIGNYTTDATVNNKNTEVTIGNYTTDATVSNNSTESKVVDEAPKALPLVDDGYTYHCFSVQKNVNGSAQMDRGCSRVTTMESVCKQLKVQNNGTELSKCVPCTNYGCNGSSALGVSLGVLMFTLIAALLSRQ